MISSIIFHLAIPMVDVEATKKFYGDQLGAKIGRSNAHAIIFDFYGSQLVAHSTPEKILPPKSIYPRHFGLIFTAEGAWFELVGRCETNNIEFYQPPRLRFAGEITEHRTVFIQDPAYNILEFKYYRHYGAIFGASDHVDIGDR